MSVTAPEESLPDRLSDEALLAGMAGAPAGFEAGRRQHSANRDWDRPPAAAEPEQHAGRLFEAVLVGCAVWSLQPKRSPSRRAIARLAWALPFAVAPVTIAAIVSAERAAGQG